jgi:hypothetical protein
MRSCPIYQVKDAKTGDCEYYQIIKQKPHQLKLRAGQDLSLLQDNQNLSWEQVQELFDDCQTVTTDDLIDNPNVDKLYASNNGVYVLYVADKQQFINLTLKKKLMSAPEVAEALKKSSSVSALFNGYTQVNSKIQQALDDGKLSKAGLETLASVNSGKLNLSLEQTISVIDQISGGDFNGIVSLYMQVRVKQLRALKNYDPKNNDSKSQLFSLMEFERRLVQIQSAAQELANFFAVSIKEEDQVTVNGSSLQALIELCSSGFVSEFTIESFLQGCGVNDG